MDSMYKKQYKIIKCIYGDSYYLVLIISVISIVILSKQLVKLKNSKSSSDTCKVTVPSNS